jgi:hypothetical protein
MKVLFFKENFLDMVNTPIPMVPITKANSFRIDKKALVDIITLQVAFIKVNGF